MAMLDTSQLAPSRSMVFDPEYARNHDARPLQILFWKDGAEYAYSPAAAYVSAVAAAWAYSDLATLCEQMTDALRVRITGTQFRASNAAMYLDTNAFFLRTENEVGRKLGILVYRGTELTNLGDYLADANVQTIGFPSEVDEEGRVHGGFYFGMDAVWSRVYSVLTTEAQRVDDLIITGHSLGGAMAVLTGALIESERGRDARFERLRSTLRGIYTFGQPAVGDAGFARWLSSRGLGKAIFRHVYGHDLVPFLPTADLTGEFTHFDSPVYLASRGHGSTWKKSPPEKQFPVGRIFVASILLAIADSICLRVPWVDTLVRRLPGALPGYSVDDHSPANYLRVSKSTFLTTPREKVVIDGTASTPLPSASPRAPAEASAAAE